MQLNHYSNPFANKITDFSMEMVLALDTLKGGIAIICHVYSAWEIMIKKEIVYLKLVKYILVYLSHLTHCLKSGH